MFWELAGSRLSALILTLGLLSLTACTGSSLPATGDSMVPVVGSSSTRLASSHARVDEEDELADVRLAIAYSTNNHGEIDPCG